LLLGVGEAQGRQRGVDHHADLPVVRDPVSLLLGQGIEAAVEQQAGAASGPAAQDVEPFAVGDAPEGEVDQLQQAQVVLVQCKGKAAGRGLDEVIDLDRLLETLGDCIVGTDGITQVSVGLSQGHGGDPGEGRAIQLQSGAGIEATHRLNGQVVIHHGKAQLGQVVTVAQGLVLARYDDR